MGLTPYFKAVGIDAWEARLEGRPFAVFTEREATDFEAFSARVVPTDDTPGAREAGVVHFADRVLAGELAELLPIIRGGLAAMNELVGATFPGEAVFADLGDTRQDDIITLVEQQPSPFFFFAKALVGIGMVSNPEYGGNQGKVGWSLMGFEDHFQYQPPFGFYDRDEHDQGADA